MDENADPFSIGVIIASIGLGFGVESMINQPKKPETPIAPALPDPNAAKQQAEGQLTAGRRALLASGGETSLTGIGGAPLLGSQSSSKFLLGS
jgi:hypothetical protein